MGPRKPSFRLAAVQMRVASGDKGGNLRRAAELIARAADGGAAVALLPEVMDVGWNDPATRELASEIPGGDACRQLADAARKNAVYVCAGLTERAGESVYNAAVLLGPDGALLLHHRKLNELDLAHGAYAQGDRLGVAHTPLGCLGLMICADAFAVDLAVSRALGYMGAQVILSPCAWVVPNDHDQERQPYGQLWLDSYGPVARQFRLWIAGVSNVGFVGGGAWAGRPCVGCSLVIGPDGLPVLRGPYGAEAETILYADIAPVPRPARGSTWADLWRSESAPDGEK